MRDIEQICRVFHIASELYMIYRRREPQPRENFKYPGHIYSKKLALIFLKKHFDQNGRTDRAEILHEGLWA